MVIFILTQTADGKDAVESLPDGLHLDTDALDHHPVTHQAHVAGQVVQAHARVTPALPQLDVGVAGQSEVQTQVLHWAPVHGQLRDLVLLLSRGEGPGREES